MVLKKAGNCLVRRGFSRDSFVLEYSKDNKTCVSDEIVAVGKAEGWALKNNKGPAYATIDELIKSHPLTSKLIPLERSKFPSRSGLFVECVLKQIAINSRDSKILIPADLNLTVSQLIELIIAKTKLNLSPNKQGIWSVDKNIFLPNDKYFWQFDFATKSRALELKDLK